MRSTGWMMGAQTAGAEVAASVSEVSRSLTALGESILARLPILTLGAVILLFLILISRPVARLLLRPFNYFTKSDLIQTVSRRAISMLIILLGLYLFLKLANLTEFAVAIISGTGVLGLILGFAFRDIAENFISSLLLTVQRPFRIGDVVQINEFMGVIQKVTARATTLVDFDGNHIQIPNATIYKGIIKNLTANPKMRGHFVIGIGYDSDTQSAQQLAMEMLCKHPSVLDDPEPQVLVDKLGSSTINLRVYYWINAEKVSILKMGSLLMRNTVELFDAHNISMPDDAREVIFPQGIDVFSQQKKENDRLSSQPREKQTPSAKNLVELDAKMKQEGDVSSENDEIRKQAKQARDPETGNNIL